MVPRYPPNTPCSIALGRSGSGTTLSPDPQSPGKHPAETHGLAMRFSSDRRADNRTEDADAHNRISTEPVATPWADFQIATTPSSISLHYLQSLLSIFIVSQASCSQLKARILQKLFCSPSWALITLFQPIFSRLLEPTFNCGLDRIHFNCVRTRGRPLR